MTKTFHYLVIEYYLGFRIFFTLGIDNFQY
jgi:hypothetical protein